MSEDKEIEVTKDDKQGKKLVQKWTRLLEKEIEAHKTFRKEAETSEDAARDDVKNKKYKFNIHWSNCKIIRSAIYANRPKPDVRRRFTKQDDDEKELARMVERALEYNLDINEFDTPANAISKDFVQTALGVVRVVYDADVDGDINEGEEGEQSAEITAQNVGIEHIPWKHFHWEPGNHQWKDVNWIAYEYFTTVKAIKDEYGVEVATTKDGDKKRTEAEKYRDEVQLFEILDKSTGNIIIIAKGHNEPLSNEPDGLKLKGFFHSPRPAFDNTKSDELVPKPDYCFISSQIDELNVLQARRGKLIASIKAVRLFDSSITDLLSSLESSADSVSIPVENMTERLEGAGGFERMIADLPMQDRVNVIRELDVQIESVKQQIYEVSGISDIVRGSTNANETAAAQQIKGQWAGVRLNDKTKEINRVWRDTLRMMAEVICEHFEPQQLTMMTGIQISPRMVEMMRGDVSRSFAIDIETDSTIMKDDMEERQQKLELVNVLLEKLSFVLPLVQQGLMPIEMVQETLLFIVSAHKHGKQLEDVISGLTEAMGNLQNLQKVQQELQQAQQQMQGMQQQLGQFNERDEARKDSESEAKVSQMQTQSLESEWNWMNGEDDDLDEAEQIAGIDKTVAETDKIKTETVFGAVRNG